MNSRLRRRAFLSRTGSALLLAPFAGCAQTLRPHADSPSARAILHLSHLTPAGARLGVAVLDTESGELFGQRLDEPFAMCSTFKLPLMAMVLRAADRGELDLDEKLTYSQADIVPHAPVTGQHLDVGFMTVRELTRATQVTSDNVAANLLLRRLGGLERFTAFCRELGDPATRLDDYEPMMNLVPAGTTRNTTTPRAMARLVGAIVSERILSHHSRQLLRAWMLETSTGKKRLRAGFPQAWHAGDKTGTSLGKGLPSCYNDVAVVWFEGRAPLIVSSFFESHVETEDVRDEDQAVLARVGYVVSHWANATRSPGTPAWPAP